MTDDWMADDVVVGSMDSDEGDITVKNIQNEDKATEVKIVGIALPITEMTDDWMSVDIAVGSIDSEDEEDNKTIANLSSHNSYADIAAKEATVSQPTHLEVATNASKLASSKTLVINVEEKLYQEDTNFADEDGFIKVTTRKDKRERSTSIRLSQSIQEDFTNESEKTNINKKPFTEELIGNLAKDSFSNIGY